MRSSEPKARQEEPLALVAVGGGVASGKSTLARRLAERLGAVHVGSDELRAELDPDGSRPFSWAFEHELYAELLCRVDEALAAGHSVVADGCFSQAKERQRARAAAERHGAFFRFVECRASREALRERLAARDAEVSGEAPFWQETHDEVASRWEPVEELPEGEHRVVHTDRPTGPVLEEIASHAWSRPAQEERIVRPDAVTFDCWNTLLYESDWELAHALRVARLQEAAREAGRRISSEEAARAFDVAWTRHMELWHAGEASGAREIARWGLAELGLADAHSSFEHLVDSFENASHAGTVRALDGARETLEALARAAVPCALVCDTGLTPGRVVREHLERLGLLDGLAVQVFSDEVGVPKPDAKAFRAALGPLGVAAERALHVGDLRRTDVAGARGLGMRTVRIRDRFDDPSALPEADFVVASHGELRELLEL